MAKRHQHRHAREGGLGEPPMRGVGSSVYDRKELHTKRADLTDGELKQIMILPTGTRLRQGGHYLDLQHLEQGEFVATSEMGAGPGNGYVTKDQSDYVLRHR